MTVDASSYLLRQMIGGDGPVPITGTTPVSGPFFAIQATGEGATIDTLNFTPDTGDSWSGITLAPGQTVTAGSINIAQVTLSEGSVIAYRAASVTIF